MKRRLIKIERTVRPGKPKPRKPSLVKPELERAKPNPERKEPAKPTQAPAAPPPVPKSLLDAAKQGEDWGPLTDEEVQELKKLTDEGLARAAETGDLEKFKELATSRLGHMGYVEEKTKTLMGIAAKNGRLAILDYLVNEDASYLSLRDTDTLYSPLMHAAENGHLNCVKTIVEADGGQSIGSNCRKGWTALMLAAKNGHDEIVIYLMENGADPNQTTWATLSALDAAKQGGQGKTAKIIKKRGGKTMKRILKEEYGSGWRHLLK